MNSMEIEITESNLRSLKEMRSSAGWSLLMSVVKDDVLSACLQMADNPTMTEKEMDFRRGAISTARNFIGVLDLMITRYESELLLASAENQTHFNLPATAL